MIQLNDCSLGVNNHSTLSLHDTAERLLTWCQQSLINSVISPWYSWTIAHSVLTITQLCNLSMIQLNDCSLGVNFSCIMERLQSWVINTKWAIVQLYNGEVTELMRDCWHQVGNRSAVSWRDYSWVIVNTKWAAHSVLTITHQLCNLHDTAELLLTWCQQSLNNSVISPWYS
jgi:hypothetical protein